MVTNTLKPAAAGDTIDNGVVTASPAAGSCSVTMSEGVVTERADQVSDSVITMMGNLQAVLGGYDKAITKLAELKRERARLEGLGMCSGVAFYRQLANGQALYANHGVGQSCPMHGDPEGGSRLRKYVGQNGQARLVLEAMERYAHWEALAMDIRTCERRIEDIEILVEKAIRVNYEQLSLLDALGGYGHERSTHLSGHFDPPATGENGIPTL